MLKYVPVFLVFHDVVLKAYEDGLLESLCSTICLWMIHSCCQMLNIEEGAHQSKEFTDESSTVVREDVRWDAERDEPKIKEDIRNMCGCCLRR